MRILVAVAVAVAAGVAGFLLYAWRPAIAAITPPAKTAFAPDQVRAGAAAAAVGNCVTCHTVEGGKAFAGGKPVPTPFGIIYATNITPDPETGIGTWSQEAFRRALRDGVDRQGYHLYPAFPYDHFTRLTDQDIAALYAFLMTREPVSARAPANKLPFPLNLRVTLAGWKLLFLKHTSAAEGSSRDPQRDRGAYLVDALAHCGACHTPRNALGAEVESQRLAGGTVQGWDAPALDRASPAPVAWDADSLFAYLRTGFAARHGTAAGPMAPVAHNLGRAPEADVRAIAVYVASVMGERSPERRLKAEQVLARAQKGGETTGSGDAAAPPAGAALFAGACASCHVEARPSGAPRAVSLFLSTAVSAPDPRNAIRIVLEGIRPPDGESGPAMPGFAGTLTDDQIADIVAYMRTRFGNGEPWNNSADRVRTIREGKEPA